MEAPTIHQRLEARLGVDVQLMYGLLVPATIIVLLVVGLALSPTWWLLPPLALVMIGVPGIVIAGFLQMLDEWATIEVALHEPRRLDRDVNRG